MRPSIALVLAGLLLGQSAPYVRTKTDSGQHCLHWPVSAGTRGTVRFVQSTVGDPTLGAGAFDAVSRSAQTWQAQLQACGDLDLVEGARSTSRFVGYVQGGQNENLVLFRNQLCAPPLVPSNDPCLSAQTCGNTYDCWEHGPSVIALTTSSYVVSSGEVLDADVELSAASPAFPTIIDAPPCSPGALATTCVANDVQNATTHELGHFLGLGHSPDSSSTMYESEPIGETSKRVLDAGSKQFVCDVYPAGQASRDCTGGSTTSGCSSAGDRPPAAASVLLLLLALGTRRARPGRPAGA